MSADRVAMLAVIAALAIERATAWGDRPEPRARAAEDTQERAAGVYEPGRIYVRRCAAQGLDFVASQADAGAWRAQCVKTPEPEWRER